MKLKLDGAPKPPIIEALHPTMAPSKSRLSRTLRRSTSVLSSNVHAAQQLDGEEPNGALVDSGSRAVPLPGGDCGGERAEDD